VKTKRARKVEGSLATAIRANPEEVAARSTAGRPGPDESRLRDVQLVLTWVTELPPNKSPFTVQLPNVLGMNLACHLWAGPFALEYLQQALGWWARFPPPHEGSFAEQQSRRIVSEAIATGEIEEAA
jgi:hypothetical protein